MKPAPQPQYVVCTNCGLDWDKHGDKPTESKCVELLKAELATAKAAGRRYSGISSYPFTSVSGSWNA